MNNAVENKHEKIVHPIYSFIWLDLHQRLILSCILCDECSAIDLAMVSNLFPLVNISDNLNITNVKLLKNIYTSW